MNTYIKSDITQKRLNLKRKKLTRLTIVIWRTVFSVYGGGGSSRRGGGKTQIWPPKINIFTKFFFGKFKENLNLEESKKNFFLDHPISAGGSKNVGAEWDQHVGPTRRRGWGVPQK